MNSNIRVLCLPWHNTGGHFINWSIYFVTGQNIAKHDLTPDRNWHNHKIKIVWTYQELLSLLDELHTTLTVVYFNQKMQWQALQDLFQVRFEDATAAQRLAAIEECNHDYRQGIKICQDRELIPVYFDYADPDQLSIYYNDRRPGGFYGEHVEKLQIVDKRNKLYFPDAAVKFGNEIWDKRELWALCFRHQDPSTVPRVEDLLDQSRPHLYYTTDDVWNGFDRCLEEICHTWDLKIDHDRWQEWQKIYQEWRTVHDPYFARHLPRIVDAVVNNKYLSLRRFRMNFFMETILLHELIFKHNLNLKNWKLDKFPANTQDLHKLLEPNVHQL